MKKMNPKDLDKLYRHFKKAAKEMAGYPLSQSFDYSKLFHFMESHINNLGNPFLKSWHYKINTLGIEKEVIDRFAEMFHAPQNSYWVYVTKAARKVICTACMSRASYTLKVSFSVLIKRIIASLKILTC